MPRAARTALTTVGAVAAVGVAATVWGIGIERFLFTVRRHTVPVLPAGSTPVRVLHLSDIHMAPWQRRKQRWIASLAALSPDLIVNTGDNLGHADGLSGLRTALAPLRGIPGVFVHGSNDYSAPSFRNPLKYFSGPSEHVLEPEPLDADALDRYLVDELGWSALDNAAARLDVGDLVVDAFGVNDAHREWDHPADAVVARDALDGPPALSLGVTHAPYRRVLDAFTDAGADLLLAGHTHGGQIRIPFSPKALVANCDIPLDQARGLSSWSHMTQTIPLNVSAGIGHSIYAPMRFGCRPEATLLTLTARDPG